MARTLLDVFDVSLDFLTRVVVDNPSLRGMILGYLAEAKLREILAGAWAGHGLPQGRRP